MAWIAARNGWKRRWHRTERRHVRPLARARSLIDRIGHAAIARFVRQEITPGGDRHLSHGHSIQSSHRRERLRLDDDKAQEVSPIVIVGGGGGGGEQVAVVPPFDPTQVHAPEALTAVGDPALHVPLTAPQTPFTTTGGTGVQSAGALGTGAGAVSGARVGTTSVPCPGIGHALCGSAGSVQWSRGIRASAKVKSACFLSNRAPFGLTFLRTFQGFIMLLAPSALESHRSDRIRIAKSHRADIVQLHGGEFAVEFPKSCDDSIAANVAWYGGNVKRKQ